MSASFLKLGALFNPQIPDYVEAAWVCAPNAAGQSITANTITTLTLDTLVRNGIGASIGSNQVTLPAGTYAFRVSLTFKRTAANNPPDVFCRLYNFSDSSIIDAESGCDQSDGIAYSGKVGDFYGQFTLSATKIIQVEVAFSDAVTVGISGTNAFTLATAGAQYRTKLQLWRFKETLSQTPIKIGGGNQWSSYAELRNLVALNAAGQTITADTLTTVQLTDETSDEDGIVSLSANQFTLGAGVYYIEAELTKIMVSSGGGYNPMYTRIQNVTDGKIEIVSTLSPGNQQVAASPYDLISGEPTRLSGVIDISSSKTFELQLICDRGGTLGARVSDVLSTASSNCLGLVKIYKR